MNKRFNLKTLIEAFTLAEVLVTLGVLGVIGAILIPSVKTFTPDTNKIMLKKSYAVLEEAIYKMVNDDRDYPLVTVSSYSGAPGFSATTPTINGTQNKFCYLLMDTLNTMGDSKCPSNTVPLSPTNAYFTTSDGVYWRLYSKKSDIAAPTYNASDSLAINFYHYYMAISSCGGEGAYECRISNISNAEFPYTAGLSPTDAAAVGEYSVKVIIDVNGAKGPNCAVDGASAVTSSYGLKYCITSSDRAHPDTFIFGIRYDGKIQLSSAGASDSYLRKVLAAPTDNKK